MKVLMGLSFMFGCIFITSGNAEAASGGWYKVTAAGNNYKARVILIKLNISPIIKP
ncbi:hypothetical protein [Bacillus thuringiensis]|uniref:hypothetical protein n=1 Tax=Bacillus thuringiensis TaxID=1428 RepID=UPI001F0F98E0|nr:hypothetical protein [Bacillus thuringiensis]